MAVTTKVRRTVLTYNPLLMVLDLALLADYRPDPGTWMLCLHAPGGQPPEAKEGYTKRLYIACADAPTDQQAERIVAFMLRAREEGVRVLVVASGPGAPSARSVAQAVQVTLRGDAGGWRVEQVLQEAYRRAASKAEPVDLPLLVRSKGKNGQ